MFDLPLYQQLLAAVDAAVTTNDKGDCFEDLCEYIFGQLEGVLIEYRDILMAAEELDFVLWNAQTEGILKALENTILVECKNWSGPVGAPSLDSFIGKMRRKNLKHGIFIAANGVTGDFLNGHAGGGAVEIIRLALQEGIRVIVLNREDLDAITSIEDFTTLLRRRYSALFVHRLLEA